MSKSKMPSIFAAKNQKIALNKLERENRLAGLYEAEEVFNHLLAQVDEFEKTLPEEQEVALRLANFGESAQMHIRSISFKNPYLIEFHGLSSENLKISLIQHVSQLNFILMASKPIEEKAYRIGFDLNRDDEDEDDKN